MKIHGDIKNFPFRKVYLTDAFVWTKILDSAVVENGKFDFELDSNSFRSPFQASICYFDQSNKQRSLPIINYVKTNSKDTFASSGFMMSYDSLVISGDYKDRFHRLNIEPTEENDLFFDGTVSNIVLSKNEKEVQRMIEKHPNSYYILAEIFANKSLYTQQALKGFLSKFNSKVSKSEKALDLADFADFIPTDGQLPEEVILKKDNLESVNLFENKHKLNMVIFWASWCGPCRLEIPHLKELYKTFDSSQLRMTSVSIDADLGKWKEAVIFEDMPWSQLLVPKDDLLKVQAQFRFNSIPHIVFVDGNNKIVKIFDGFYPDNVEKYIAFIKSFNSVK